jgi:hypothetical protein
MANASCVGSSQAWGGMGWHGQAWGGQEKARIVGRGDGSCQGEIFAAAAAAAAAAARTSAARTAAGTNVLFSGLFRPNSPILPQNRPQIFTFTNSSGSVTSSYVFGRSLK